MARSVQQIYQSLIDSKVTYNLPTNNNPMSLINRLLYVFALATNQFELLLDIFKADVEAIANQASFGSYAWLRKKTFEFQYDATNPQVVSFNPVTLKTEYENIDATKRIVSAAAVNLTDSRIVQIKVAKGVKPNFIPLDSSELNALNSYFDAICPAGQNTTVVSREGDDLTLDISLYYSAQSSQSAITAAVTANIENYLYNIEFDGTVVVNRIIDAIQATPNVINGVITNAEIDNILNRGAGTTFTVETNTYSGYIRTLTLNFIYIPR